LAKVPVRVPVRALALEPALARVPERAPVLATARR